MCGPFASVQAYAPKKSASQNWIWPKRAKVACADPRGELHVNLILNFFGLRLPHETGAPTHTHTHPCHTENNKKLNNRNEIIEFSFPFYVFTSAPWPRHHFPRPSRPSVSPPLSMSMHMCVWPGWFRPICIQKAVNFCQLEETF